MQPRNDKYTQIRTEADKLAQLGMESEQAGELQEAATHFRRAIDILTQIPDTDLGDDDYRSLVTYHNDLGSCHVNMAKAENDPAMQVNINRDAMEWLTKAAEFASSIEQQNTADLMLLAAINGVIFELASEIHRNGIGPESFEAVCKQEIAGLVRKARTLPPESPLPDEHLRCHARWLYGLSFSGPRVDNFELLYRAFQLQEQLALRLKSDNFELARYHYELAAACEKDDQLLDAAKHCQEALELLDTVKDLEGVKNAMHETQARLSALGNNPQNRRESGIPARQAALLRNSEGLQIWARSSSPVQESGCSQEEKGKARLPRP